MILGIPTETYPGENRVAIVPAVLPMLKKLGIDVLVQSHAGAAAGYPDEVYRDKGAEVAGSRDDVFARADIVAQVRAYGANLEQGGGDLERMRRGQVVIGTFEPLTSVEAAREVAARGVALFALELIPRITRAQSMDVLSSMATIAGYKAVLLAADQLPKMFPMMMTAAGTITPAKVFVIGAGVAGLQAISTSRRLGAVVQAYDVRAAVKEQVLSVGAKFVEMELDAGESETEGGYAKALGEEFYKKQRELMGRVIAESDVVITTAAVPGKKAPVLITRQMVELMAPGSVIVDLAAERGGNCESTRAGDVVTEKGVKIIGPINLPADVPFHASQMFSKNVTTFLQNMVKEGKLEMNLEDEIVRETLVTRDGDVVHPGIREALGLASAPA